jgi:hypothetical protein
MNHQATVCEVHGFEHLEEELDPRADVETVAADV